MSTISKAASKVHKLHSEKVMQLLRLASEKLGPRRVALLSERSNRLDHLLDGTIERQPATKHIRKADWTIEPVPEQLFDLRANLIGSANREELIAGLNSDANCYFADLWNMVPQKPRILYRAHRNLSRAVQKDLSRLDRSEKLKLKAENSTNLVVVPRPIHVLESSVEVLGQPIAASIYDIIVHCVLNGETLIKEQGAVLFALRRVFSHLEARWFNTLFELIEEELGFERGAIRTFIMIDSIEAALELDEILFELQFHTIGLTLDPQRYALSHIELFSGPEDEVMPDREIIGLDAPFLKNLCIRILGVSHNRGAHALFPPGFYLHPSELEIPIDGYHAMMDEIKNGIHDGYDGAIVSSTEALKDVIDQVGFILGTANQICSKRKDSTPPQAFIERPVGELSTSSLIQMVRTALRYRMAERLDKPWAVQGGRKHDRSSMKLALGILRQWRNSNKGVITQSGLPIDDQLLQYLVEKETKKMFSNDPATFEKAQEEATYILERICS